PTPTTSEGVATTRRSEGPVIPKAMKAVLLTGHGGPEKLVYREDGPGPGPAAGGLLGQGAARGLKNTDVWGRPGGDGADHDPGAGASWRRSGEGGNTTLSFPRIQGTDIVGRIVAVGAGVAESRIGERVVIDFSLYNRADDSLADIDYIGHGRDGGYAEFA